MADRVLVVGGGGREHAIVAALAKSRVELFVAMKNRNPGISRLVKDFKLINETDVVNVVNYALSKRVDMVVVGPEAPLEAGLADALIDKGILCVGPKKQAARIETDKAFARALLDKYKVQGNLRFGAFADLESAKRFLESADMQVAIKPIGLTGGKGVKVEGEHLKDRTETLDYVREIFDKRIGGAGVVIEEKIVGEEFTLQAFCDGKHLVAMPAVQDHKRAFEGDVGPNTGGMGSYSVEDHLLPFLTSNELEQAKASMRGTVEALAQEGTPYQGILYGQFMLTANGPRIIEFNARFGDPEAMNVLPIMDSDFDEVCARVASGHLSQARVRFEKLATVCKYVVPEGYGQNPKANLPVEVDEAAVKREGAQVFFAAVNEDGGRILTSTSRALGVVGIAKDLESAEMACERALLHVRGEAIYVRHDIGKPAIIQKKVERMLALRKQL